MPDNVRFQQYLDEQGNHVGWLDLVEVKMSDEQIAKEMEYLAKHPYYRSEKFLEDSKGYKGPPRESRSRIEVP